MERLIENIRGVLNRKITESTSQELELMNNPELTEYYTIMYTRKHLKRFVQYVLKLKHMNMTRRDILSECVREELLVHNLHLITFADNTILKGKDYSDSTYNELISYVTFLMNNSNTKSDKAIEYKDYLTKFINGDVDMKNGIMFADLTVIHRSKCVDNTLDEVLCKLCLGEDYCIILYERAIAYLKFNYFDSFIDIAMQYTDGDEFILSTYMKQKHIKNEVYQLIMRFKTLLSLKVNRELKDAKKLETSDEDFEEEVDEAMESKTTKEEKRMSVKKLQEKYSIRKLVNMLFVRSNEILDPESEFSKSQLSKLIMDFIVLNYGCEYVTNH